MKRITSFLDPAWRIAVFVGMLLVLFALARRIAPGSSDDATVFLSREALAFVSVLLASWIMARIERRTLADYGLPWRSMFGARFWQGALMGFAAGTVLIGLMWLCGAFHFGTLALHGVDIVKWGVAWAFAFLLVGLFEEFTTRGYALVTLARGIGFWPAAVCTAALFGWSHYTNAGEDWIGLFNAGFFGLLQCFFLRRTGNLWFPIGVHAAFDWSESYFYGAADSGQTVPGHLFETTTSGPAWLSGGTVGPEGSLIATALVAAMWLVGAWWLRDRPHADLAQNVAQALDPGAQPSGGRM